MHRQPRLNLQQPHTIRPRARLMPRPSIRQRPPASVPPQHAGPGGLQQRGHPVCGCSQLLSSEAEAAPAVPQAVVQLGGGVAVGHGARARAGEHWQGQQHGVGQLLPYDLVPPVCGMPAVCEDWEGILDKQSSIMHPSCSQVWRVGDVATPLSCDGCNSGCVTACSACSHLTALALADRPFAHGLSAASDHQSSSAACTT